MLALTFTLFFAAMVTADGIFGGIFLVAAGAVLTLHTRGNL